MCVCVSLKHLNTSVVVNIKKSQEGMPGVDSNSSVLLFLSCVRDGQRAETEDGVFMLRRRFEWRTPSVTARLRGASLCVTGRAFLFVTSSLSSRHVSGGTHVKTPLAQPLFIEMVRNMQQSHMMEFHWETNLSQQ